MEGIFGPLVVVLAGAVVGAAGFLPFRETLRRVRRGRTWPRSTAYVTRAWKVPHTSFNGGTSYSVNYTFTADETGGSYHGHSEHGPDGIETGDDMAVLYDPKAPHNNDVPLHGFELWSSPFAYGVLTVFGAALALLGVVVTATKIIDLIS